MSARDKDIVIPGDTPLDLPNVQVSAHYPPGSAQWVGHSDRDNFIRDMVTILYGVAPLWWGWSGVPPSTLPPVPVTPSASGRTPLIALDQIKLWLHIEPEETEEDDVLVQLEMAAHLMTERHTRQTYDADAEGGIGENVKQACLLLIAHWYRNRETVGEGRILTMPLAYEALLSTERDYSGVY